MPTYAPREHFVEDGVNRVILATDGDFNVGVSGDDALVSLVEKQAKSGVFLTVLGVGTGLTIASGGSVGHEGPTVAIGATVGSVVARFFGLRLRRHTTMLGAGCAAGLASAFTCRATAWSS